MVFLVVQWKDEDSISVVNEKEVVESPDNFKQGENVTVITKNSKGKSSIYIAEVLKVFATKSKALEHEKELLVQSIKGNEGHDEPCKRSRKPSKKIREADEQEESQESRQPAKKKKLQPKSSEEAQEKKEDKIISAKEKQLKEGVQKERIDTILKRTTVKVPPPPKAIISSSNLPPLPRPTLINTHAQIQYTPSLPTVQTTSNLPTFSQQPLINTHAQIQNTPSVPTLQAPSRIQAFAQQPFINTNAQIQNTTPPRMAAICSRNSPSFSQHAQIQNTPPLPTLQTSFPQNTTQFQTYPHSSTPSKFSFTVSPTKSQHTISYTEDLMRDDFISLDYSNMDVNNSNSENAEWNSFSTHFTSQFEKMKAEMHVLRSEVKSLRRAFKELKSNPTQTSFNQEEAILIVANKEDELSTLIKITNKPLDGLKKLLYHLFTDEEVRTSSIKGVTTATGGATCGLNNEHLELIYCLMKKRYEVEPKECDKLIRGQQRKLREKYKKQNY